MARIFLPECPSIRRESGYNLTALFNNAGGATGTPGGPMTLNSLYNKPLYYQLSRNIRMAVKFTF